MAEWNEAEQKALARVCLWQMQGVFDCEFTEGGEYDEKLKTNGTVSKQSSQKCTKQ